MNRSQLKKKGFSLIELIVVISIIGVLVAIGTVSFITAQRKSRDAARKSDIKAVQSALEQYFQGEGSVYPASEDCSEVVSAGYLQSGLPGDPRVTVDHQDYTITCTTNSYCACALLEESATANSSDASCTFGGTDNTYYCTENLQ